MDFKFPLMINISRNQNKGYKKLIIIETEFNLTQERNFVMIAFKDESDIDFSSLLCKINYFYLVSDVELINQPVDGKESILPESSC